MKKLLWIVIICIFVSSVAIASRPPPMNCAFEGQVIKAINQSDRNIYDLSIKVNSLKDVYDTTNLNGNTNCSETYGDIVTGKAIIRHSDAKINSNQTALQNILCGKQNVTGISDMWDSSIILNNFSQDMINEECYSKVTDKTLVDYLKNTLVWIRSLFI